MVANGWAMVRTAANKPNFSAYKYIKLSNLNIIFTGICGMHY